MILRSLSKPTRPCQEHPASPDAGLSLAQLLCVIHAGAPGTLHQGRCCCTAGYAGSRMSTPWATCWPAWPSYAASPSPESTPGGTLQRWPCSLTVASLRYALHSSPGLAMVLLLSIQKTTGCIWLHVCCTQSHSMPAQDPVYGSRDHQQPLQKA